MSASAQPASLVKESLFQFITKNLPDADLNVIDEIVLAYVISYVKDASLEPCFDIEGFMDLMSTYMPEFASVEPDLVGTWALELEAELCRQEDSDFVASGDDSPGSDKVSLTDMLPPVAKVGRSHTDSESSASGSGSEGAESRRVVDCDAHAAQSAVLREMFPNASAMEIKHCISIAYGDLEHAASMLLHRMDQGQALSAFTLHGPQQPVCDDHELKSRIIARYSYVDTNAVAKEHKPLAPKLEPKKMIRYRDNKIVSLKGERYTEVSKNGDEETSKKQKKQHCP